MTDETEVAEAPQPAEIDGATNVGSNAEPAFAEPAEAPAADPEPELEELLQQFDAQIRKPEPAAEPPAEELTGELDELERLVSPRYEDGRAPPPPQGDSPQEIEQRLRGEIRNEYQREWERLDFERSVTDFARDVQTKRCPESTPPNYVENELRRMDKEDPTLGFAWYAIRIGADPNWCRNELENVRRAASMIHPASPTAGAYRQQLENYAGELYVAINARQIVRTAVGRVVSQARAAAARGRLDENATEARAAINYYMRGASSGDVVMKEPELDWGSLELPEFRREVRKLGPAPQV
jgi:hypothetical protein